MIIDGEKHYNRDNELIKDNSEIIELIDNYKYDIYCDLNLDINKWEKKLNRILSIDEKKLFIKVFNEKDLNKNIFYFKKILMKSNCYIKEITNYEGNCLFESLVSLGIYFNGNKDKISDLREHTASVLKLMQDNKDFFEN